MKKCDVTGCATRSVKEGPLCAEHRRQWESSQEMRDFFKNSKPDETGSLRPSRAACFARFLARASEEVASGEGEA